MTLPLRSRFELETFLVNAHPTLSRKIKALNKEIEIHENKETLSADQLAELSILKQIKAKLLTDTTEEDALANFEVEEPKYWVEKIARQIAIDLLTIGKTQPETLLQASYFVDADLTLCVQHATTIARKINNLTIDAEQEIVGDIIPDELLED